MDDVVPLRCLHGRLSRPFQFDRSVVHRFPLRSHLCRALATGNSRALRSPFELLQRTLTGLDSIPKTSVGPLPKQFSLRLGNGPLALSGAPADPGNERK